MDGIQKYLLSAISAIVLIPIGSISLGLVLGVLNFINYYIDSVFLNWFYHLFLFRDGLYEEYTFLFYLISYCFTIIIIKKLIDIVLVVLKKA
jgi:hypothetical protein